MHLSYITFPKTNKQFTQFSTETVKIPFLLWAIHNGTKFRIVIGSFEQNLAKTISVYVHKSNDLRWLPKVIFLKKFVTAEACNSSDNQKTKTATWRSQQLSAWISYPNLFFLRPKSSIQVFFLGLCQKYLTFLLGLGQFSVFHKCIGKIQFLIGHMQSNLT